MAERAAAPVAAAAQSAEATVLPTTRAELHEYIDTHGQAQLLGLMASRGLAYKPRATSGRAVVEKGAAATKLGL